MRLRVVGMAKPKIDLESLGGGAALKESIEKPDVSKPAVKHKVIKTMPAEFFERHKALKASGKTSLLFTPFIIEAVRKALEEHEQQ